MEIDESNEIVMELNEKELSDFECRNETDKFKNLLNKSMKNRFIIIYKDTTFCDAFGEFESSSPTIAKIKNDSEDEIFEISTDEINVKSINFKKLMNYLSSGLLQVKLKEIFEIFYLCVYFQKLSPIKYIEEMMKEKKEFKEKLKNYVDAGKILLLFKCGMRNEFMERESVKFVFENFLTITEGNFIYINEKFNSVFYKFEEKEIVEFLKKFKKSSENCEKLIYEIIKNYFKNNSKKNFDEKIKNLFLKIIPIDEIPLEILLNIKELYDEKNIINQIERAYKHLQTEIEKERQKNCDYKNKYEKLKKKMLKEKKKKNYDENKEKEEENFYFSKNSNKKNKNILSSDDDYNDFEIKDKKINNLIEKKKNFYNYNNESEDDNSDDGDDLICLDPLMKKYCRSMKGNKNKKLECKHKFCSNCLSSYILDKIDKSGWTYADVKSKFFY